MWYVIVGIASFIVGILAGITICQKMQRTNVLLCNLGETIGDIEDRVSELEKLHYAKGPSYFCIQTLEEANAWLNEVKLKAEIVRLQKLQEVEWSGEMIQYVDRVIRLVQDARNGKYVKGM